jgi:subtilisin
LAEQVLDTGIAPHPDLNVIGGRSFVNNSNNPDDWTDRYAHGTLVAGIIGARNNGMGVWGVLPGVPLFSAKVLSDQGAGTTLSISNAVRWLVQNGAGMKVSVINLSLGGIGRDPFLCDAIQAAVDSGMVVVAAAGNSGVNMSSSLPANCAAVIAVTALDLVQGSPTGGGKPASYSNW